MQKKMHCRSREKAISWLAAFAIPPLWLILFPVAAAAQAPRPLQVEVITLTTRGFEPKQITRPAGRFVLAVNNRAGLKQMSLKLSLQGLTTALRETLVSRQVLDRREFVDLPVGVYVLTETRHPTWICLITVN